MVQIKRSGMRQIVFLCAICVSPSLSAIPVEIGATVSGASRSPDRYTRGISEFRTALELSTQHVVLDDEKGRVPGFDLYVRFFDPDAAGQQSFGLTFGTYRFAESRITEIRTDRVVHSISIQPYLPYFMFTYDYRSTAPFSRLFRRWRWEAGMGFGLVPNGSLKITGWQLHPGWVEPYNGKFQSKYGSIARLNGALVYPVDSYVIRTGLRLTYVAIGDFNGQINGTDATLYYLANGSILPLTQSGYDALTLANLAASQGPSVYGSDFLVPGMIQEKVLFTAGMTEFFVSVSVRTGN